MAKTAGKTMNLVTLLLLVLSMQGMEALRASHVDPNATTNVSMNNSKIAKGECWGLYAGTAGPKVEKYEGEGYAGMDEFGNCVCAHDFHCVFLPNISDLEVIRKNFPPAWARLEQDIIRSLGCPIYKKEWKPVDETKRNKDGGFLQEPFAANAGEVWTGAEVLKDITRQITIKRDQDKLDAKKIALMKVENEGTTPALAAGKPKAKINYDLSSYWKEVLERLSFNSYANKTELPLLLISDIPRDRFAMKAYPKRQGYNPKGSWSELKAPLSTQVWLSDERRKYTQHLTGKMACMPDSKPMFSLGWHDTLPDLKKRPQRSSMTWKDNLYE